jgi:chorismate mutase
LKNLIPIQQWFPEFETDIPLISGPCSAESELQLMQTAEALANTGIPTIYRAGVWKPRTKPGSFEGSGLKALKWLEKVRSEFGFRIGIEVATDEHVLMAMDHGIDILWIGARTSVNPFSVQEIADVLVGNPNQAVMVKNPINPDLNLWIGAMQRIAGAGINKIAAIHRGFSTWEKSSFRNPPMWELPIELKRQFPELDIFCDPSHICGIRETLPYVSQKALDLSMSGLMLESHINPDEAWTDAKQQLTPTNLKHLMGDLQVRKNQSDGSFSIPLSELRTEIDSIDNDILKKIKARMAIVDKIGEHKRDHNIAILQVNRWDEIVSDRMAKGQALGLDKNFMKVFLEQIHKASISRQTSILNNEDLSKNV